MIVVTRLNGPQFAVNPDLLQRIESSPDTVLTLFDGTKYIVEESTETIIDLIRDDRARVIARAQQLQREAEPVIDQGDPRFTATQNEPDLRFGSATTVRDADADHAQLATTVQLHPRRR